MGFLSGGLTQEFSIKMLNGGVLVGASQLFSSINSIECLGASLGNFWIHGVLVDLRIGLASPHDATSGAGHDLHQMVLFLAGLDGIQDLLGVVQPVGDCDVDLYAANLDGGFLDAGDTPDILKYQGAQFLAGEFHGEDGGAVNHFDVDRPIRIDVDSFDFGDPGMLRERGGK